MRIVENFPPPPPKPPRTFDLMEVSEEELRHIQVAVAAYYTLKHGWSLYESITKALADDF